MPFEWLKFAHVLTIIADQEGRHRKPD